MHACKWPCQYDPSTLSSPFKVAWQRPPLPPSLPFLGRPTNRPTSDSHAISCMCSGACVRVCMICRKVAGTLARDSFVQMLARSAVWFRAERGIVYNFGSEGSPNDSESTMYHAILNKKESAKSCLHGHLNARIIKKYPLFEIWILRSCSVIAKRSNSL